LLFAVSVTHIGKGTVLRPEKQEVVEGHAIHTPVAVLHIGVVVVEPKLVVQSVLCVHLKHVPELAPVVAQFVPSTPEIELQLLA